MADKNSREEILKETAIILSKNWGIEPKTEIAWEQLLLMLKERIMEMLQFDSEKLVSIMYRIDVSEPKFHEALSLPSEEKRAERLAELVLYREMEKIETRLRYKGF